VPWSAKRVQYEDVARLRESLGCPEPLAWTLVRRGLTDPQEAKAFLSADAPLDPPTDLAGVEEAAERLADAIARSEQIVVHGDYDCDGISSTAMLARAVRSRGGKLTTFLPSRFTDGYGVSMTTVERLAREGGQLLVCVDCGTTARDELERAHELGMQTIVLDHHLAGGVRPPGILANPAMGQPRGALPSAAGVVLRVVRQLAALDGPDVLSVDPLDEIDLAALATVADAVPLRDENRRVVAQGIAAIRERPRPGIRALLDAAGQDYRSVDARTLGYTLGPAVNASGRLDHPDRALGLLLETDRDAARPVAERLWELNTERREIERRITDDAIAQFEASPDEHQAAAAIVVGGEGWHEGVVGIVASRLAERYERPAIVISIDGDAAKGSGRSVPGVDLHGLVSQSDDVLTKWGGHEGAVGLSLARDDIPALRDALCEAAEGARAAIERSRVKIVDAVAAGSDLSLAGAEAFEALAPYGRGNPSVSLLIPGASIRGVGTMGADGRHLQVGLTAGGVRSRAVGFSLGHRAASINPEQRHDVVAGLSIERWQETVGPRVTLRGLDALEDRAPERARGLRVALASTQPLRDLRAAALADARAPGQASTSAPTARVVDTRGTGALSRVVALSAADNGLIVVTSDAVKREVALRTVLAPRRLGCERVAVVSADRDPVAARAVLDDPQGGALLAIVDYAALEEIAPGDEVHLLALDPPSGPEDTRRLLAAAGGGWLHLAWGPEEQTFARQVLTTRTDLRALARQLWPVLRDCDDTSWAALAEGLVPGMEHAGIRAVALALRALGEAGLCELSEDGVQVVPGAPLADLAATPTGSLVARERSDGERYLDRAETLDIQAPELAVVATAG